MERRDRLQSMGDVVVQQLARCTVVIRCGRASACEVDSRAVPGFTERPDRDEMLGFAVHFDNGVLWSTTSMPRRPPWPLTLRARTLHANGGRPGPRNRFVHANAAGRQFGSHPSAAGVIHIRGRPPDINEDGRPWRRTATASSKPAPVPTGPSSGEGRSPRARACTVVISRPTRKKHRPSSTYPSVPTRAPGPPLVEVDIGSEPIGIAWTVDDKDRAGQAPRSLEINQGAEFEDRLSGLVEAFYPDLLEIEQAAAAEHDERIDSNEPSQFDGGLGRGHRQGRGDRLCLAAHLVRSPPRRPNRILIENMGARTEGTVRVPTPIFNGGGSHVSSF
jgi:hypothetical protein